MPRAAKKTASKPAANETPVLDLKAIIRDLRETSQRLDAMAAALADGDVAGSADEEQEAPAVDAKTQKAHDKRQAELSKKNIRALKALATKEDGDYGFEDDDVADASKEDIIKNMLMVEFPDVYPEASADDADDDDDSDSDDDSDDDDDDADEEVSREDLLKLDIKELKKMAVASGIYEKTSEMKGMDRDSIVDAIMDHEADDEDEDEDDEGEEFYTREDYEEMSLAELKAVADEAGVKYKKGVKQDALIDLLLEEDE